MRGDDIIERFVAIRYDETLAPVVENVWDVTTIAVLVLLVLDQRDVAAERDTPATEPPVERDTLEGDSEIERDVPES